MFEKPTKYCKISVADYFSRFFSYDLMKNSSIEIFNYIVWSVQHYYANKPPLKSFKVQYCQWLTSLEPHLISPSLFPRISHKMIYKILIIVSNHKNVRKLKKPSHSNAEALSTRVQTRFEVRLSHISFENTRSSIETHISLWIHE